MLVFGGLGFIGLNLVRRLREQNVSVVVVTRTMPRLALQWLSSGVQNGLPELVQADLCAPESYQHLVQACDLIYNLAGHSGAAQSLLEAHTDMQSNVEGNLALLEVARRSGKKPHIVFASSRLVYGYTGSMPATEDAPLLPTSIYGLHKLTVEHYYRLYGMHYGVPYTIVRLTNPYGPYQLPDSRGYGIVNSFIMRALGNETLQVFGDGNQLRDYVYIEDVIEALLCIGYSAVVRGQILNIGLGRSIRLAEMAEMVVRLAGNGSIEHVPWPSVDRKVETGDFICSIARARKLLGWQPQTDWERGLRHTIHLYQQLLP
ncbi:MAG: NAD-dependent epimerase/dehydratase family protein [Anaerolineae bacterium]|nr:NAD-dependent epimerase/dehydratase family protein [Anaerolineae bacterium]